MGLVFKIPLHILNEPYRTYLDSGESYVSIELGADFLLWVCVPPFNLFLFPSSKTLADRG